MGMENYPRNIIEFEKRFSSEQECRKYLFSLRWPECPKCPKCLYGNFWMTKRGLYRCSRCRCEISVTAGTIFQDTKKPLCLWFRAIWYATNQKHGISALGLQRALGIGSYHTAW